MTLYEINSAIQACLDYETGEVLDKEALEALELAKADKIEGVACWMKNMAAEAAAIKEEEAALKKRRETAERLVSSLKDWLGMALNGEKFATPKCAVSFRSTEAVALDEDSFINWAVDEGRSDLYAVDIKPSKTAIKKAIMDGEEIPGAMIERRMSVIVR